MRNYWYHGSQLNITGLNLIFLVMVQCVDSEYDSDINNLLSCPQCQTISEPQPNITLASIIQQVHAGVLETTVAELPTIISEHAVTSCRRCKNKPPAIDCMECGAICDECSEAEHACAGLRHHRLYKLGPSGVSKYLCHVHKKPINFYCNQDGCDDKRLICLDCACDR